MGMDMSMVVGGLGVVVGLGRDGEVDARAGFGGTVGATAAEVRSGVDVEDGGFLFSKGEFREEVIAYAVSRK